METTKTTEYVRYKHNFSEEEINQKSRSLADMITLRSQVMDEKKEVMASYKAKLEKISADINESSTKITSGYEFRKEDCTVERDFSAKVKRIISKDTGEVLEELMLEPEDYQLRIDNE